jgi:protocatechuate 3,4-dioxygenase beta subunit
MSRHNDSRFTRREAIAGLGLAWGFAMLHGTFAFAQELVRTPNQTRGPFYPDALPLDTDNDLLIVNDSITPAVGAVTWLSGRILDARGEPLRNALVEIWQVDSRGVYLHRNSDRHATRDRHFQGFGRFLTGSSGDYVFRTVKPVPYPGRTPHIHMSVRHGGKEVLATQCYVRGEPQNETDGVLRGIRDARQRDSVIVPFDAMPSSRIGELAARFDIVLGFTPQA